MSDNFLTFRVQRNEQVVQGIPIGRLNNLENRIAYLETHGSGGGPISIISISGTIDDSNVTFTSATEPTLVNVNGAFYQKTGGAITWTYVGTTITLSSPIGTGGSIFGI